MNITESEVRQALEALEDMRKAAFILPSCQAGLVSRCICTKCAATRVIAAIATLKEALARPSTWTVPFIVSDTVAAQKAAAEWRDLGPMNEGVILLQDEPGKDARKLSKHLAGKLDAREVVRSNAVQVDAARLDWLEQATWLNFSRLGCEHKVMTGSKLRWHIDRAIAQANNKEKP